MRWAGPLLVLLLAATGPLLVPPALRDAGLWPEFAVLGVVCMGFRGTPDRAALLGVAAGFLASLWSPEPLFFRPFVLGTVGYAAGQVAGVLRRDSTIVGMTAAGVGVLAVRLAEQVAAALAAAGSAPWTAGEASRFLGATIAASLVAALSAPLWFAIVRRWGLLAPLERSFRDV